MFLRKIECSRCSIQYVEKNSTFMYYAVSFKVVSCPVKFSFYSVRFSVLKKKRIFQQIRTNVCLRKISVSLQVNCCKYLVVKKFACVCSYSKKITDSISISMKI